MLALKCTANHIHNRECYRAAKYIAASDATRLRTVPEDDWALHLDWVRGQCSNGWALEGWQGPPETVPRQHAVIAIPEEWRYCPLCGRQVR